MNIENITDYDIIKEIGRGNSGIVYKIKIDDTYYALKITKITDSDLKEKSRITREHNFFSDIGNKYPEYFTRYYGYHINNKNLISNEKLDIIIDINDIEDIEVQKYVVKHKNSNTFMYKIYDLVSIPLENIILQLSIKQIYSMIIQITNIIRLLHKNNYIHGDINLKNIGVCETNNKYIQIDDVKYETFGYIYKLIDFDTILHNKDIIYNYEKNKYPYLYEYEYLNLLNSLIKINVGIFDKYSVLKYWYLYENKSNNNYIDENYEYLLKNNKIDELYDNKYINLYIYYLKENETIVPKEDIQYIINHRHNYDDIIKYFGDKLNNCELNNGELNNKHYDKIKIIMIIIMIIIFIISIILYIILKINNIN